MKFWIPLTIAIVVLTTAVTLFSIGSPEPRLPEASTISQPAASASPSSETAEQPEGPRIEVLEGLERELGAVIPKEDDSIEFTLKNVGDADLVLERGDLSCTCAAAELSKRRMGQRDSEVMLTLPPGETATYTVHWDSSKRRGPFSLGAALRTNDPTQSSVRFVLKMDVTAPYMFLPASPNFGLVRHDEKAELNVLLYSLIEDDFEILDTSFSSDAFEADIQPLEPLDYTTIKDETKALAKAGYRVSIRLVGELPNGPFEHRMRFETNIPEKEEGFITFTGDVQGGILPSPRRLDFKAFDKGQAKKMVVQILAPGMGGDEDLRVGEVEPAFIETDLKRISEKGRWALTAVVSADAPAGNFKGKVSLLGSKDQVLLVIPTRGTITNTEAAKP